MCDERLLSIIYKSRFLQHCILSPSVLYADGDEDGDAGDDEEYYDDDDNDEGDEYGDDGDDEA